MASQNEGLGLSRIRPLLEARGMSLTLLAVDDKPAMVSAALVDDFGAGLFLENAVVRGVSLASGSNQHSLPELPRPGEENLAGPPAEAPSSAGSDQARPEPGANPKTSPATEGAESASAAGTPGSPTADVGGVTPLEPQVLDPHDSPTEALPLAIAESLRANGCSVHSGVNSGVHSGVNQAAVETTAIGLEDIKDVVSANYSSNLQDWLAVVHVAGQKWTLAYHAIFKKSSQPLAVLSAQAQEISESLGCRALLLQLDGADNELGYQYFIEGKLEEHAMYRPGGEVMAFESQSRLPPEKNLAGQIDPFESLCAELALEIPACFPSRFPNELVLLTLTPPPASYDRVDLIVLPIPEETSAMLEEDDTVIFQNPLLESAEAPESAPPPASPVETKGFWKNVIGKLFG